MTRITLAVTSEPEDLAGAPGQTAIERLDQIQRAIGGALCPTHEGKKVDQSIAADWALRQADPVALGKSYLANLTRKAGEKK